jgi:hypothetical protein
MIRKILIYEADFEKREKLAEYIRAHLNAMGLLHIQFRFFAPHDVFDMADNDVNAACVAFITLDSQNDAKAAQMFGKTYRDIPLVVVSNTAEYGLASWSWGTRFYLIRPFNSGELQTAWYLWRGL